MRAPTLLWLFATATAVLAQGASSRPVPTGIVTGHVYCADTNGPARMAEVILEPAQAIDGYASGSNGVSARMNGVQTMPDGSFAMQHVAPGTYYVFASEPGYVSPLATIAVTGEQLNQPDKEIKAEIARAVPRVTVQANLPAAIDVTLQRGAAVSGTVLYDDGSPAAGLEIKLLVRQKDKWVEPRTSPVQTTPRVITDDRGMFRIAGLPAREYLVSAKLTLAKTGYNISGGGFGTFSEGDENIPVYSGSKLRSKDAVPFRLKLGEERPGEDITIPLAKLHSVSGTIAAARDGHTLNGGTVTLLYADDRSEVGSTTLARGETAWAMSFVPEGDYILRITDGADMDYEEIANPPGTVPFTTIKSRALHRYGPGEQPLHVEGDVSGLEAAVPELAASSSLPSQ